MTNNFVDDANTIITCMNDAGDVVPQAQATWARIARRNGEDITYQTVFFERAAAVAKFNPYHDDHGRFGTGSDDNARDFSPSGLSDNENDPAIVAWQQKQIDKQDRECFGTDIEALNRYGAFRGEEINVKLRARNPQLTQNEQDQVDLIDATMNPIDENLIVWRAIDGTPFGSGKLAVGKKYSDKGYTSTSVASTMADSYTKAGGTAIRMRIPKGTKVAFPHAAMWEREVLIHRGATFKIDKVYTTNGKHIAEVSYVPTEK